MTIKLARVEDDVTAAEYGAKAHWLSWLRRHGYNVPEAVFLPAAAMPAREYAISVSQSCDLLAALAPFIKDGVYHVAVRSSATSEDSELASMAGHFKTLVGAFTAEELFRAIEDVVASREGAWTPAGTEMGVIIQRLIEPSISGVAFSSDPVSRSKLTAIISSSAGFGSALVSGHVASVDTFVDKKTGSVTTTGTNLLDDDQLAVLMDACSRIEGALGLPVDLEWCVDKCTGCVHFLQCRPATAMLHHGLSVVPVNAAEQSRIPRSLWANKKVYLRIVAERYAIPISPAYLVFCNSRGETPDIPSVDRISISSRARGYSAVLIQPEHVDGRVVRRFADKQSLQVAVDEIARISSAGSWSSTIIVQEIYEPQLTGIARLTADRVVLDIGLGHFVPKGVVPVSEYLLGSTGEVLYSQEVTTDRYYRIAGDAVTTEHIAGGISVSLPPDVLRDVVELLRPVLEPGNQTVEFGVLRTGESKPFIYLIDLIQENVGVPDAEMIEDGVISRGAVTGRLVRVSGSEKRADSLDLHHHDEIPSVSSKDVPRVFASELPALSLLDIVKSSDPSTIGFIFREGSVLCHLAIVLRERGIPAVRTDDFDRLVDGAMVSIDADAPGRVLGSRVKMT